MLYPRRIWQQLEVINDSCSYVFIVQRYASPFGSYRSASRLYKLASRGKLKCYIHVEFGINWKLVTIAVHIRL